MNEVQIEDLHSIEIVYCGRSGRKYSMKILQDQLKAIETDFTTYITVKFELFPEKKG